MTRLLAILLCWVLLGAAPVPASDRAYELIGTWSCRTTEVAGAQLVFRRVGDDLALDATFTPFHYAPYVLHEDYRHTGPSSWTTRGGLPANQSLRLSGGAWTSQDWSLEGPAPWNAAQSVREHFTLRAGGTLLRTFENPATGAPQSGELCRRGGEPPPADACVVPNLPASTLRAAMPDTPPEAVRSRAYGTVQVLVSLDRDSTITAVRILSSPSNLLDAVALRAARGSAFRTRMVDCIPQLGDYVFSVTFAPVTARPSAMPTISSPTQRT